MNKYHIVTAANTDSITGNLTKFRFYENKHFSDLWNNCLLINGNSGENRRVKIDNMNV